MILYIFHSSSTSMMKYMILCPVLQNRPPFPRSKDSHRLDIDILTSRTSSCFWMWRWALQWSHTCDTWHSPATPSRGLRPRGSRDARTHGRLVTATITHRLISHLRPGTVGVACPGKSETCIGLHLHWSPVARPNGPRIILLELCGTWYYNLNSNLLSTLYLKLSNSKLRKVASPVEGKVIRNTQP